MIGDSCACSARSAIRWVAGISAAAVVVLFTALSFGLHGATGTGLGQFERGDQAAMIGLGVLIGLGILAFTRPRVRADADGIKIRNVVGGYDLPWSVVRAVRFDRNSPWATLELHDDDQVPVHALQAADKDYAVRGRTRTSGPACGAADAVPEPDRLVRSRPRPAACNRGGRERGARRFPPESASGWPGPVNRPGEYPGLGVRPHGRR